MHFHRLFTIDDLKRKDKREKNTIALNRGGYAESDSWFTPNEPDDVGAAGD